MHFAACVDHSPPSFYPRLGLLRLLCFCLYVEPAVVPLSIQAEYRHMMLECTDSHGTRIKEEQKLSSYKVKIKSFNNLIKYDNKDALSEDPKK